MRRHLLRRTLIAVVVGTASAAFTGSLVGIATTRGKLRPDGATAAIAARQRAEQQLVVRPCPRAHPARRPVAL